MPSVECGGTAVAWHFCYYSDERSGSSNTVHSTEFGIYRPSQRTLVKYELVPNTKVRINRSSRESSSGQLTCEVMSLNVNEQFSVMEGDMIGVCVFASASGNDGDDNDQTGGSQQQSDRGITVSAEISTDYNLEYTSLACFSSLPSLVLFTTTLANHALHVALEVGKYNIKSYCTIDFLFRCK